MIHAAAPCPVHTKQEMIAWWGNSIWEYYAATEGGGTVVGANDWSNFPGTVGKAWPGADIKIILDNQEEASVNEQGTVYMRLGDATKFEYKEIKEKFLYNISLIPNLETAPKAPPKPTNIIFKSIMI